MSKHDKFCVIKSPTGIEREIESVIGEIRKAKLVMSTLPNGHTSVRDDELGFVLLFFLYKKIKVILLKSFKNLKYFL